MASLTERSAHGTRTIKIELDRAATRRRGNEVRVEEVAEQLDPVDQSRTGAGEVRRRVDGDDPGPARREAVALVHRLLGGALDVVAARHRDDQLGPGVLDL